MRATTVLALAALLAIGTTAFGQEEDQPRGNVERPDREREEERQRGSRDAERPAPPDAERSGPRQPDRQGSRGMRPPGAPMLMFALDANRDGELSAEEISQAVESLKKLDKNEDGVIDREELRPVGRPDGGPDGGPRGGRPPATYRRPPADDDRGPRGEQERTPRGDGGDGRPPAGDRGPRGQTDREGRGRRPAEFGDPRMDPERFVERLMQSDADGDGKLSREELLKAVQGMERGRGSDRPRGDGRPGPGDGRGPDGDRGSDRGDRDAPPERDRERPQRPL